MGPDIIWPGVSFVGHFVIISAAVIKIILLKNAFFFNFSHSCVLGCTSISLYETSCGMFVYRGMTSTFLQFQRVLYFKLNISCRCSWSGSLCCFLFSLFVLVLILIPISDVQVLNPLSLCIHLFSVCSGCSSCFSLKFTDQWKSKQMGFSSIWAATN